MDIQAFPLAFIEFIEEDGLKRREGPISQSEEDQVNEKWKVMCKFIGQGHIN